MNIDLAVVARDLKLPPDKLETTVQLLDEGNTIPFITRFRKDQTGGLDENQILAVKQKVAQLRALAERKTFVLKSVESQGGLTDDLKAQIDRATSSGALEDLYLPFKARKQNRAATARQQGLGPLADDILSGASADQDLSELATRYVRVDKGLSAVDDVFKGVGDLLVEKFSEHRELRSELRRILWTTGKLTCQAIVTSDPASAVQEAEPASEEKVESKLPAAPGDSEGVSTAAVEAAEPAESVAVETAETVAAATLEIETPPACDPPANESNTETVDPGSTSVDESAAPEAAAAETVDPATAASGETVSVETSIDDVPTPESVSAQFATALEAIKPAAMLATAGAKKKKKKKKKKKVASDPFKDYHDFCQPLRKLPQYRVLAINRGERAGALKVKIDADVDQLTAAAITHLVPPDHPFTELLKKSATESLNRVVLPSLEREVRRELTETAEKHAVNVFANNLRSLLLQPPIRDSRVLAIDPGFKRGCSVAVLDAGGTMLESGHVFVVGNKSRIEESGKKIAEWITQHQIELIAIGNGTACRQVEQMVSDVIVSEPINSLNVRYVIVNEAGASIYSTSEIGREELPDISPSIRSAVSIGRRLQDPLSELVKISPANIGVGMYQHDVKAKHLSESLDDVVQFCTNRIGVNVNSASPSLLKYVSGLNALTARRIYEHRKQNGNFKSRQQLRDVSGFGDATFLQAAGFLRIHDGESPLDATAIHPESYPIADGIMQKAQVTPDILFPSQKAACEDVPPSVPNAVAEDAVATVETNTTTVEEPPTPAAEVEQSSDTPPPAVTSTTDIEAVQATDEAPVATESTPDVPKTVPAVHEGPTAEEKAARSAAIGRFNELSIEELAGEFSTGTLLVKDILLALKKPDWDPRDRLSRPIFRRGIMKPDDLKPEMQLDAQIVNVVDFGVFVDIGLGESCLVHVSELSHSYIRDPHDHYSIGQVLKVWVSEVDGERRRVKLTAIRPGTKKPNQSGRGGGRSRAKPSREAGADRSSGDRSRSSGTGGQRSGGDQSRSSSYRGSQGGGQGRGKGSGSQRGSKPAQRTDYSRRKPSRPKPVKPITDQMLKGDEPMRSFSDLMQFVTKKPGDEKSSDKKDSKD